MDSSKQVLNNKSDAYNTRYIKDCDVPNSVEEFEAALEATLKRFREEKVKGIFLDIHMDKYQLIGVLKKHQFTPHHTLDDIISFKAWIPEGKCRLPSFSTHYAGVGGLVIDFESRKALVIKEKSGTDTFSWKIPGGLVDAGEYFSEAVEREVWEETGIKAKFKGVLAQREKKNYYFGRNDVYTICLLIPDSVEIHKCEYEVATCEWKPVDEWLNGEFKAETQKFVAIMAKRLVDAYHAKDPNYLSTLFLPQPVYADLQNLSKGVHQIYSPISLK